MDQGKREAGKMSGPNLYKRNGTYYARKKTEAGDIRRSLRTGIKVEALKRLRKFLNEVESAEHGQELHSWKDAVVEWSQAMVGAVKPDVLTRYKISLRMVRPVMDGLYIENVSTKTIADVVKYRRAEGATNATIKRDLTALSSVLRYCCAQAWRDDNPAMAYDRTVIRERRDPIILPETADVEYIAQRAGGNFGQAIRYAAQTGMRQEEIFSLEWDQVRGTVTDLWKTKTSRARAVQNSIAAQGTLKGTKRHTKSPWVFWHTDGQRYAEPGSQFRAIVQRALDAGKIKRAFRFHDLRHLFAVEYLRAGGLLYNLQKHMGHASIKTTELYLDYLTPEEAHKAKFGATAQKGHKDSGLQTEPETATEAENA